MTAVADGERLVSVLVVNFHAYEELDRCLASLAGDPQFDGEVVVVDHESRAASIESLRSRHPDVRFFPTDRNPGFASGVNAAARHAAGRYLLLLNPDATVQPGAALALREYLETHPDVGIVGARVLDPDGRVQRSARRFPTPLTGLFGRTSLMTRLWPGNPLSRRDLPADEQTDGPLAVDWVAGSCLMVRREAFDRVRGFDEAFFLYWEDADFCLRVRDAGWRTVYCPAATVTHGVGASSRHAGTRSIRAFHESAVRYFEKHNAGRFGFVSMPLVRAALAGRLAFKLAAHRLSARGREGDPRP